MRGLLHTDLEKLMNYPRRRRRIAVKAVGIAVWTPPERPRKNVEAFLWIRKVCISTKFTQKKRNIFMISQGMHFREILSRNEKCNVQKWNRKEIPKVPMNYTKCTFSALCRVERNHQNGIFYQNFLKSANGNLENADSSLENTHF